jgi:antitoxin HicB
MSSKNVGKNADYYLGLEYPVVVRKLRAEEGGGYLATIPQLGWKTFIADGDTPQEAYEALDNLRQVLIPELLSQGVVLPEPVLEDQSKDEYSGNVLVRMATDVHARVAADAKRHGCSLNARINQYIAEGLGSSQVVEEFQEAIRRVMAEEVARQNAHSGSPQPSAFLSQSLWVLQEQSDSARACDEIEKEYQNTEYEKRW